jgi:hypothetical protein
MNRKYLIEQTTSDAENLFNGLKKYIDVFNSLTEEQIEQRKNDPNGVGLAFFDKAEEALNKISQIDSYSGNSLNYINSNKEEIVKTINDFKNIFETNFPEIYDQNFKSQFDTILGSSALATPSQSTQASEAPKTQQDTTQPPSDTTTAPAAMEKPKYDTSYTGPSIVDFLKQSGQPSDFESRRKLAVDLGIVSTPEEYEGLSQQNIRMLDMLRGTTPTMDGVETRKAELAKPYTKPKGGQGPTIRYAGREYPAYIDMGGGKYRLAYQEELDNPNMQLYIPNPKKGQQEYGKPNFVKVRREGGGIRRQSQFGGALGSASNLLGDIGNTLAGKR